MKRTTIGGVFCAATLVLFSACGAHATEAPLALEVAVRARAIGPGEPVRILVRSPVPLESLGGTFLGAPVHFRSDETGTVWRGWGMVELSREPGTGALEVSGMTAAGRGAIATRAVTVESRDFPTENLSVAPRYVEPPPEVQQRLAQERATLARLYRTRSEFSLPDRPFLRPVPGPPTSVFGTRRLFNGQPRDPHSGWDLDGETGETVLAAGDGRVALAQDLYYSGNTVILDHGSGLFTLYAHLSRISVEPGSAVSAGDAVGEVGATGRVTGPHLHWGAKIGDRPFDPAALMHPTLFSP